MSSEWSKRKTNTTAEPTASDNVPPNNRTNLQEEQIESVRSAASTVYCMKAEHTFLTAVTTDISFLETLACAATVVVCMV